MQLWAGNLQCFDDSIFSHATGATDDDYQWQGGGDLHHYQVLMSCSMLLRAASKAGRYTVGDLLSSPICS